MYRAVANIDPNPLVAIFDLRADDVPLDNNVYTVIAFSTLLARRLLAYILNSLNLLNIKKYLIVFGYLTL